MNARQLIEEEKLQNILNPRKSNREFKVTIRFQKHLTRNFEKALELARRNSYFMEEGAGDHYRAYASFHPPRSRTFSTSSSWSRTAKPRKFT